MTPYNPETSVPAEIAQKEITETQLKMTSLLNTAIGRNAFSRYQQNLCTGNLLESLRDVTDVGWKYIGNEIETINIKVLFEILEKNNDSQTAKEIIKHINDLLNGARETLTKIRATKINTRVDEKKVWNTLKQFAQEVEILYDCIKSSLPLAIRKEYK